MWQLIKYLKSGFSYRPHTDQVLGKNQPINPRQAIKRLIPFLRPHVLVGLTGSLLILLSSLLVFPQPLVYRYLVDDVILAQRLDLLPWAILLYAGLRLLIMGASFFQGYFVSNFEYAVIMDIQSSLMDHVLQLPKAFFDKQEIGYLVSRISDDVQGLRWLFSGVLAYLVTNLIQFIGGLGFLFYLDWRLALFCLVSLPILILAVRYFSKRLHSLSHAGMENQAKIIKRLQETIASIPLIKAFTTEQKESDRIRDALENERQIRMEQTVVGSAAGTLINLFPDLSKLVVLVAGAYLAIQGEWTLGSLLAFQSYLSYVYSPAMFFANANIQLQRSIASLERVMNLFDVVPEENRVDGLPIEKLNGDIVFDHVTFAYSQGEAVLDDISFTVRPGEKVAIVGPSGVGKTTLVSLILSFYKPQSGQILFDGMPSTDLNLPALRKRIGYVSQGNLLLSGTFAENLRYGQPEASDEDLARACKAVRLHEYINSLPGGYSAKIDERGLNLSEGQKQRLSIARALIMDPDIFIFDEPTSALDSTTEHEIFEALPEFFKGKTIFVIAHRLATIQSSDKIMLLNATKLIDIGTHKSLLNGSAIYRHMVENQEIIVQKDPEEPGNQDQILRFS